MGPRAGSELLSEKRGLAGCLVSLIDGPLLGLPPAHPMILGAGLTPGLVRDGGSVAGDAEP